MGNSHKIPPEPALVEVIAIGREILDGRVIDTNSVNIAKLIRPLGLIPRYGQRVDDQIDRVVEAFKIAQNRSRVVLVTGGLGPTSDDLTAEAFAKFLGVKTEINLEAMEQVENFFSRLKRPMNDWQRKQAYLPSKCGILKNREGSAPGFYCDHDRVSWYFMPGVPKEMIAMLKEEVLSKLPKQAEYATMTWATQFNSEGALQEILAPLEKKLPADFEVSYRTHYPENHIALYAIFKNQGDSELFDRSCLEITSLLGSDVFWSGRDRTDSPALEEVVLEGLKNKNIWLGAVESCTGGLVAQRMTSVAGSSQAFWGALVTYDNLAKTELARVPESLIVKKGAVSPEVAQALAAGGLDRMKASAAHSDRRMLCVATTGIAGPSGGTEEKPTGLCYIALADSRSDEVKVEKIQNRLGMDRSRNMTLFSQKALEMVRSSL